jgi:hypothetical protein
VRGKREVEEEREGGRERRRKREEEESRNRGIEEERGREREEERVPAKAHNCSFSSLKTEERVPKTRVFCNESNIPNPIAAMYNGHIPNYNVLLTRID